MEITYALKHGKRYVGNMYYRWRLASDRFPPEVWIETTNYCNALCSMCPRERHTRPLGFMDFALFEKLIKEISAHRDTVRRMHLANYGEPLLDKDLCRRIKLAKDYGIRHVYFVTNASLLTPELSEQLILSGLDEFKVSLCGADRETYNATMKGLDFDKTAGNIKGFFKVRDKLNVSKPKVTIQYLPQSTDGSGITKFLYIFNSFINKKAGDSLFISTLNNYGDGRNYQEIDKEKICSICRYPWRTVVILYDGKVVICCMDYNGVQVLGDVNKDGIERIWNSDKYRMVKNDFKNLRYEKYPVCKRCDLIR